MAEEAAPTSIANRIAALKLAQVGKIPGQQPPTYDQATNTTSSPTTPRPRPPPPPRPALPARPDRPQSANLPPTQIANKSIGNQPEAPLPNVTSVNGANGAPRPPLPSRTSTQSSQLSQGPTLPPRRPSGQPSPALPPRRPSEAPSRPDYDRSRRDSTESTSSVATTRSSVSAISNATSLTSQGERYKIKAPEYDPSSLPALPPKRTKEEKEAADRKYAGLRPLRQTKSTPKVAQISHGTTPPPPARQAVIPPLPVRNQQIQEQPLAIEAPVKPTPVRSQPPPPPTRADPAPPPPARSRPSALSWGLNKATDGASPVPAARPDTPQSNGAPPPIPTGSKPDLAALQASKPKMNGTSHTSASAPVPAASSSGPVEITSLAHFSQIIASSQVVIADFYADYCGPCKQIAPVYNQLCSQFSRPNVVTFVKINRPAREDLYSQYGVQAMPTFLFFKNGTEIDRMVGASKEGLEYIIEDMYHEALKAPAAAAPPPSYAAPGSCLHCRDFSGPDNHAARFPREAIPSSDVGWLAHQLTSPFSSHTDKARAIFTWLHHNIAYDTVAFFGGNIKPSTPQGTIQSGLAVCEGYAGLFAAIAVKAGMEAIVVGGHGKGYGHTEIQPGQPVPPVEMNHAWNAVKIDGGEWKLLDACWGAGNTAREGYTKAFKPVHFTESNNDFGLTHYPEDSSKQFRTDGRRIGWEEYILGNKDGCGAQFFSGYVDEEGLSKVTFQPNAGKINLAQQPGPTVRFSFQKICPHWDPLRNGKGPYYVYILTIDAKEGTPKQHVPFQTNGEVWWCDAPVRDLGRSGAKVHIWVVNSFDNKDGRGLAVDEFKRRQHRVARGYGFVCTWVIA